MKFSKFLGEAIKTSNHYGLPVDISRNCSLRILFGLTDLVRACTFDVCLWMLRDEQDVGAEQLHASREDITCECSVRQSENPGIFFDFAVAGTSLRDLSLPDSALRLVVITAGLATDHFRFSILCIFVDGAVIADF